MNPQDNSQPHPLFEQIERTIACQIVGIKVRLRNPFR
jgi:hypothetical protein